MAKRQDARIAAALQAGGVGREISATTGDPGDGQASLLPLHGLVAISCDVRQVNRLVSKRVAATPFCWRLIKVGLLID